MPVVNTPAWLRTTPQAGDSTVVGHQLPRRAPKSRSFASISRRQRVSHFVDRFTSSVLRGQTSGTSADTPIDAQIGDPLVPARVDQDMRVPHLLALVSLDVGLTCWRCVPARVSVRPVYH